MLAMKEKNTGKRKLRIKRTNPGHGEAKQPVSL